MTRYRVSIMSADKSMTQLYLNTTAEVAERVKWALDPPDPEASGLGEDVDLMPPVTIVHIDVVELAGDARATAGPTK